MTGSRYKLHIFSHDILEPGEYIITRMPDDSYSVWHPGIEEPYQVSINGRKVWTCTCPSFYYRPGHCKHITKVITEGAWNDNI